MKAKNTSKSILALIILISVSLSAQESKIPTDYTGRGDNFLPVSMTVNEQAKALIEFNKVYLSTNDISLREAYCIKAQYKLLAADWQSGDLFAGRITKSPLGISPQASGYIYYFDENRMLNLIHDSTIIQQNKRALQEMVPFWRKENTNYKAANAYPAELVKALPPNNFMDSTGVGFPLYRISGTQMDFDKLIQLGIPGLQDEIDKYTRINTSSESQSMYKAMKITLNTFVEIADYYISMLENQKAQLTDKTQIKDIDRIINSLQEVTKHKPENFHQAIQLFYLYAQFSGSINYGRIDEYLGDIYQNDLVNGKISKAEAEELFVSLFKMMESNHRVWDTRAIVGGKGRRNEQNANQMALVIMDAVNTYHSIVPQLTLRFYKGQDSTLYNKAIDMIGAGYTYPMLYNDDVNIPSVQAAFKIPADEAVNYLPFGCGEYIIYHKSVGTPSGLINMLQALTVTLHNGKDPITGKSMGLALGNPEDFKTFDQLMKAYNKQVEYFVYYLAQQEAIEYKVAAENASLLMLSMLFDDCIAKGKPLLNGGVRYMGGTLESYGNTNSADAMSAIKKLVYDEKKLSLKQIVTILDENFVGFDKERNMMLDAPKYGNDDDYVDSLKVQIDRHLCEYTRSQNEKNGLHSYLVVLINNSANTSLGLLTPASADGRLERTYMANANAPTGGADKNGITSMLNSMVKPSTFIHAGAVQNMKFSKELFIQNRPKIEALLNVYWKKGGAQAMLSVIGRDDLENAMKYPEKYSNLIVRVGGFCARFVELPKSVQLEVLSRTMY